MAVIMRCEITRFALEERREGFALIDIDRRCPLDERVVEVLRDRLSGVDAYEKARAEVRRDIEKGADVPT